MRSTRAIHQVAPDVLELLRGIDSVTVSNAIERLDIRLRNEGFTDSSLRCLTPKQSPMVGYAVTGRVRTSETPTARHWYYHRMDWWSYLVTIPEPRVIVLQDIDDRPGFGALFGEVSAYISQRLGCAGYVTNGVVRGLPGVERTGMHVFASGMSVSHAYAHIVDFGGPVEVAGMPVGPGDLLHGDRHGLVSVPAENAAEIPGVAAELCRNRREILRLCDSPGFSLEKLEDYIRRNESKLL